MPRRRGAPSVVRAEFLTQHPADLAHRAARAQRHSHRYEQVRVTAGNTTDLRQRPLGVLRVPLRPDPCRALELSPLRLGVEPVQLHGLRLRLRETVDADDHSVALLHLLLVAKRGLLDLVLDEAALDRLDRAAQLVDSLD